MFAIEREINGLGQQERRRVRQERSRPLITELQTWLREQRAKLSKNSDTTKAIKYCLSRCDAFTRFLDDGRLCMSNTAAERETCWHACRIIPPSAFTNSRLGAGKRTQRKRLPEARIGLLSDDLLDAGLHAYILLRKEAAGAKLSPIALKGARRGRGFMGRVFATGNEIAATTA